MIYKLLSFTEPIVTHRVLLENAQSMLNELSGVIEATLVAHHNAYVSGDQTFFSRGQNSDTILNQVILDFIHARFPDHAIFSEEGEPEDIAAIQSLWVWIVDPVDGTRKLEFGEKEFSSAICLSYCGRPLLSMIVAPFFSYGRETGVSVIGSELLDGVLVNGHRYQALHLQKPPETQNGSYFSYYGLIDPLSSLIGNLSLLWANECPANWSFLQLLLGGHCDPTPLLGVFEGIAVWDFVAGAYLISKAGGTVSYDQGDDVFPLPPYRFGFTGRHRIDQTVLVGNQDLVAGLITAINRP